METGGPFRHSKARGKSTKMIATRSSAYVAHTDSPAVLRLQMLEMKIVARGRLPEAARRSACDLIDQLKRSIAEKPSLSFADAVAKLKTLDEIAEDRIGEKADDRQKDLIRSAIAALRRQSTKA